MSAEGDDLAAVGEDVAEGCEHFESLGEIEGESAGEFGAELFGEIGILDEGGAGGGVLYGGGHLGIGLPDAVEGRIAAGGGESDGEGAVGFMRGFGEDMGGDGAPFGAIFGEEVARGAAGDGEVGVEAQTGEGFAGVGESGVGEGRGRGRVSMRRRREEWWRSCRRKGRGAARVGCRRFRGGAAMRARFRHSKGYLCGRWRGV